jgi:DNA mismatch repair protein MutL
LTDTIHLLPDHIANQIAAGEVIQRPASAVKELLENAVDAGATEIKLIFSDAGKALVQVIDNGKGMSEGDARMAFERHATSKISNIEDLFRIRTMGFRGEALASIAAVARVEMKTRKADEETGIYIEIENSLIRKKEAVASPPGTNIAMKNLFFSVPARRNFLKSPATETRHIIEELFRVALAFPGIFFSANNNGQEIFHLEKGTLKQRIVQLMGDQVNARLVTVQENTNYLNIYGFVGKPDTAKRTRGDQYFFVNNRYIRSPYLNHAVMNAYQQMIPADCYPLYVLFIELDPAQIDINVHPTKQEIKFEDEKILYAFVNAAVKHALAQFSITPTLDFDLDPNIQGLDAISKPFTDEKRAAAASGSLYKTFTQKNQAHFIETDKKSDLRHWRDFYESYGPGKTEKPEFEITGTVETAPSFAEGFIVNLPENQSFHQLLRIYILVTTESGFLLVHQQRAHERILYERYQTVNKSRPMTVQSSLFPVTINLSVQDAVLLEDISDDLREFGFLIEPFGKNAFIIQGTPADTISGNEKAVVENLLEQFKHYSSDLKFPKREKLIRSLAWQQAVKSGTQLSEKEMQALISDLFQCSQPNIAPNGRPALINISEEWLEKLFR